MHHDTSAVARRRFLAQASALVGAASLGQSAFGQAAPTDYKALVCVFMAGGNDGHNTVVPLTPAAYAAYKAARGGLSLPDGNTALLQVNTPGGVADRKSTR